MNGFHLRPARTTDAGRTGTILSGFIDETDWMPRLHSRAQDLGFVGSMIDRGWVTVAEADGIVVGFSVCDEQFVHALYIDADARRQGCGTALLAQMQQVNSSLTLWTFQANGAAQDFYLRHGFVELDRSDGSHNDEGLPDVRLRWNRGSA